MESYLGVAREEGLTDERWSQALFTANKILDAYFLNYQKIIQPKRLLDGNEISQIICGTKGKIIGNILGKLAEAQVAGEINTKSEAIKFVEEMNQLG